MVGDGDNTLVNRNPFNSTIFDNTGGTIVNDATTYGVDLDTYDVSPYISAGESSLTTRVESGQDFVILNAVVLKVPSNLITGIVYEDLNYGGGVGRNLLSSSGVPIEGVDLELYDNTGSRVQRTSTDDLGSYVFGGMANGSYNIRVINNSIQSTRTGGAACSNCIPVQTFKTDYIASVLVPDSNTVGGENPSGVDPSPNTLTGAQSISSMTIFREGVAGMDFGFNFNTIVNTNEDGQGSLEQFIVNSNNLDETVLDIDANSIFDPAAGDDTSIFMIPPTADPLGRTSDSNFSSGIFDILISSGNPLSTITGSSTIIDGRTQTAYSGNSNAGTVGAGGTFVGTSANPLPDYERPEIQVHRNNGDVIRTQGDLFELRNLAVFGNNNASVRIDGGSATIWNNLLGINAVGVSSGNVDYGVEVTGGTSIIEANYIAQNTNAGVYISGGTAATVQDNHIADNGSTACTDNISLLAGANIIIRRNLINTAASLGIDDETPSGGHLITENTITNSGQDGGNCGGSTPENAGVKLDSGNSTITNNIIASNGGAGIILAGGIGNRISQNSIYANGTSAAALGIDIDSSGTFGDGVTVNDTGDIDSGPNDLINFPFIETVFKSGANLVVSGWSRPGATIEFFLTDISQGTASIGDNQLGLTVDYGEGQVFLTSLVEGSVSDADSSTSFYSDDDGNTDNTNRFRFTFAVDPSVTLGDYITTTATLINSTSEFSPFAQLKAYTIITNRRITYRINKN